MVLSFDIFSHLLTAYPVSTILIKGDKTENTSV